MLMTIAVVVAVVVVTAVVAIAVMTIRTNNWPVAILLRLTDS